MSVLVRPAIVLCLLLLAWPLAASDSEPGEFQPPDHLTEGWYARIETGMGRIIVRLLPEQAPQSVAYFTGLAEGTLSYTDPISGEVRTEPYYDGTPIHTVYAGRFFETGDVGAVGRSMPLLYVPNPGVQPINFSRSGAVGHTRLSGDRISAVKFFVTASPQPWLNGDSPCFGKVVSGEEVVFNISQAKSRPNRRPIEDILIDEIRVFVVGDPPPIPETEPFKPKTSRPEFRGN